MVPIAVLVTILALGAAPAIAQDPVPDAYGGPGTVLPDVTQPTTPPPQAPAAQETPGGDVGGVDEEQDEAPGGGGVAGIQEEEPGGGGVAGITERSGDVAGVSARGDGGGGTLPFTGLDLVLMAAGGLLLLGLGVSVRRLSRSGSPA